MPEIMFCNNSCDVTKAVGVVAKDADVADVEFLVIPQVMFAEAPEVAFADGGNIGDILNGTSDVDTSKADVIVGHCRKDDREFVRVDNFIENLFDTFHPATLRDVACVLKIAKCVHKHPIVSKRIQLCLNASNCV